MISDLIAREVPPKPGGTRLPRHIGLIPDGNRRWARARGLAPAAGYAAGVGPGLRLLECAEAAGIEEVTAYGYTKENVCRPKDQVRGFERACIELAELAVARGTGVLVVGDVGSRRFPDVLRPWAYQRSPGRLRFNLVVNYNWQWDLAHALRTASRGPYITNKPGSILGSSVIPRIDLVVRWGGRHRLSGFLPIQCAYADFYSIDTLWPDMQPESLYDALRWYARQEVTLGG